MYHIVYGLLYLVSLLPLRILYIIGDAAYLLVYYVVKYRRDVVFNNLQIAFPEKSEKERTAIAKKFYHNLIDTFIESLKLISASDSFLEKRFSGNWDVINNLKAAGKPVQLHMGHNFNWEWGNAVGSKKLNFLFLAVYMPINNKVFDRLFKKLRSRNGTVLLSAHKMQRDFLPYRNEQYLLGLVADQNPGSPENAWWFNFFGKPAPFVKGPAKNAISNNTNVVFGFIEKKRRGYYKVVFSAIEEDVQSLTELELTKKFVYYLQEIIKANPDMWLWSHRRWKREWQEGYEEIIL